MSPHEIGILMHHYTRPTPYSGDEDAAFAAETIADLCRQGLLKERAEVSEYGATHDITERGEVYMVAITRLPLPTMRWVMPEGVE